MFSLAKMEYQGNKYIKVDLFFLHLYGNPNRFVFLLYIIQHELQDVLMEMFA